MQNCAYNIIYNVPCIILAQVLKVGKGAGGTKKKK